MTHPLKISALFNRQHSYVPTSQHDPTAFNHPLSHFSPPSSPSQPGYEYTAPTLATYSSEYFHPPSIDEARPTLVDRGSSSTSKCSHELFLSNKYRISDFIPEIQPSGHQVHHVPERRYSIIGYRRLVIVALTGVLLILAAITAIVMVHLKRVGQTSKFLGDSEGDLTSQSGLGSARNVSSSWLDGSEKLNFTTHHTFAPDSGKRGGGDGYDSLIIFGASYCDNAHARPPNLRPSLKSPPYYKGRWTNGPVWNEYLSGVIGPGGGQAVLVNYAFGGATVDNDLNGASVPDLKQQVSAFLSDLDSQSPGAGPSNGKSLISVWIGINSVTRIWKTVRQHIPPNQSQSETQSQIIAIAQKKIHATVDKIFDVMDNLVHATAFKNVPPDFLLLPIPPADLLLVNIQEAKGNAHQLEILMNLSDLFNARFAAQLKNFQLNLSSGQKLFTLDIPTTWRKFMDQPSSASLTTVNQPCLNRSGICKVPDSYLYWDALHPTTQIHKELAIMMNTVIKA